MAPDSNFATATEEQVIGVIIVDHGSRREDSNRLFEQLVRDFEDRSAYSIVEPAHMDLASPNLETAFDRCVHRGASFVVVNPFFLLPGRHLEEDIPTLAASASARHPGIDYTITEPVGLHPLMADIVEDRITAALGSHPSH